MSDKREETLFVDASEFFEASDTRFFLVDLLQKISPYAQAARRYSVTDKRMDVFTAEVLAAAAFPEHLMPDTIRHYVAEAPKIQTRAKTLYRWACEAYGRTPKLLKNIDDLPEVSPDASALAEQIPKSRLARSDEPKTRDLKDLCFQKLGSFSAVMISSIIPNASEYDPYSFIHETVCSLAGELSPAELEASTQVIEKETLKLVSLMTPENILIKASCVRTSKIVVVDDKSNPRGEVAQDRV